MNEFLDRAGRDVVIGIDIGGTNLRAAAFRGLVSAARRRGGGAEERAARPIAERREPVGLARTPEDLVQRVSDLVDELTREVGLEEPPPVGVGVAAMMRGKAGHVAVAPHLDWVDVPLGEMLSAKVPSAGPVVVNNDVNAITFGEFAVGSGRGASDVLVVFMGTGIGGGAIVNGQLVTGHGGAGVEIGHTKVIFDERARPCRCGHKGCVEAYSGGENLLRRIRGELGAGARSRATELAGGADRVLPSHVDDAAAEGDDYALQLFADVAPLTGAAIANAVTLFNPEVLVLGGGMLQRMPVFQEHVIAAFEVAVNTPALGGLRIENAALADDAGLVGSALLAERGLREA